MKGAVVIGGRSYSQHGVTPTVETGDKVGSGFPASAHVCHWMTPTASQRASEFDVAHKFQFPGAQSR